MIVVVRVVVVVVLILVVLSLSTVLAAPGGVPAAELASSPGPALAVTHAAHVRPLGLVGGRAAVLAAAGAGGGGGGGAGEEGGLGDTETTGVAGQPRPQAVPVLRTVRPGLTGLGLAVVHTPVDQAAELVAQPGAVAVVQAGNLGPSLLQGVEGEEGGEAEDQSGQQHRHQPGQAAHLTAGLSLSQRPTPETETGCQVHLRQSR